MDDHNYAFFYVYTKPGREDLECKYRDIENSEADERCQKIENGRYVQITAIRSSATQDSEGIYKT